MDALKLGLAGDAAWRLGGRVQAGIGNLDPAIGALAIAAGFDPAQCGIDGSQLGRFVFVQGELKFTRCVDLGARVLGFAEVLDRSLGPTNLPAAQRPELLHHGSALGQQLLFEGGVRDGGHGLPW